MNKENIAATPTFTRKRAKSFSTPPSAKPVTKSSRGILKGKAGGDDAHTIAFIPIHSPSAKQTGSAEKRRKSMSRRVSFASHAAIHLIPQPGEASPQEATPRRSNRLSPAKSPIRKFANEWLQSPTKQDSSNQEDSSDELAMELTTIFPQQGQEDMRLSNPLSAASSAVFDDEDVSQDDGGEAMDEDDTAAMDLTDVVPIINKNAVPLSTPRRSMLPVRARQSPKSPRRTGQLSTDEDQTMDMTTIFSNAGPVLDPSSPFIETAIAEGEDGMDMTRIVGGILSSQHAANGSPARHESSALMRQQLLSNAIEEESEGDRTMNMEETRVFSHVHVPAKSSLNHEDNTAHTSYTVATEEDSTQRFCEGSITQADGLTQNMEFTQVLNGPKTALARSPNKVNTVGFAWGAAPTQTETSLMDVSMHDITQSDETMNMDITQAVPSMTLGAIFNPSIDMLDNDTENNEEMSFTQVLPPQTPQLQTKAQESRTSSTKQASRRSSQNKPRLSSGALRSPYLGTTPTSAAVMSPRRNGDAVASAVQTPLSRRKSLLEQHVPQFGTPEAKILLEPGSSQRPEFSSTILEAKDARLSLLQEKIHAMTPKKSAAALVSMSPEEKQSAMSPTRRARFQTPQKTPQRSLLMPYASVSKTASMTPARSGIDSPLPQVTLDEFLKMTNISFLTNLSTTRRRETIALAKTLPKQPETEGTQADKLIAKAYTMPMLEMYQHSCRELNRYIEEGRAMCTEIEADMNEQNPDIFEQYRRASPVEKRDLETKFKALKTMSRLSAKGVWYVWRTNLIESVLVPLKKNLADLEKEAAQAAKDEEAEQPKFEETRKRYEELKAEAERLAEEQALYDAYDHAEAARLKKSIEEGEQQLAAKNAEVEALIAQDAAAKLELEALEEEYAKTLQEVNLLEEEAEKNRGYSLAEIAELKQTYADLVASTGLQIVHVTEGRLDMSFEQHLYISVSLTDMSIELSLSDTLKQDVISCYYLQQLSQSLQEARQTRPSRFKDSLALIRNQWSAVTILRREICHLEIVYPVSVKVNEDDNIQVSVSVLLPASRTKFVVDFIGTPSLSNEEFILEALVCVKYGGLDGARVQQHIQSRLQNQSPQSRSEGWLLDALKMPEGL